MHSLLPDNLCYQGWDTPPPLFAYKNEVWTISFAWLVNNVSFLRYLFRKISIENVEIWSVEWQETKLFFHT